MADSGQQQWPNRRDEILGSTVPICIIATVFLIWRVVYGILSKRKLLLCDYLLVIAAVSLTWHILETTINLRKMINVCTTAIRFKTTHHGQGRKILDPSIRKPDDLIQYSYFLWIGQVLNLIAVAILKYSICAYLLALKFSKIYMGIVWASVVMVSIFNVLFPMLGLFGCTPFEANWNKAMKGKCVMKQHMGITYLQV